MPSPAEFAPKSRAQWHCKGSAHSQPKGLPFNVSCAREADSAVVRCNVRLSPLQDGQFARWPWPLTRGAPARRQLASSQSAHKQCPPPSCPFQTLRRRLPPALWIRHLACIPNPPTTCLPSGLAVTLHVFSERGSRTPAGREAHGPPAATTLACDAMRWSWANPSVAFVRLLGVRQDLATLLLG